MSGRPTYLFWCGGNQIRKRGRARDLMNTVLIIDELEIFRAPLAACFREHGFKAVSAADGAAAMALLAKGSVDLIIIDCLMTREDGGELLKRIRDLPATQTIPIIILTTSSDKAQVVQAARFGIRDFILKSHFTVEDAMARSRRLIARPPAANSIATKPAGGNTTVRHPPQPATAARAAAAAGPGVARSAPPPDAGPLAIVAEPLTALLTQEESIDRARHGFEVKGLAGILTQVVSLAGSPRSDSQRLANLISRDPMLCARVLRTANSVQYASIRGPVSTISEAVKQIGVATVRNIAAAMGLFDAIPARGDPNFNPIRYWQHSIAVATLCERLLADVPDVDSGIAFVVGLCHDLGELLFDASFGREYQHVREAHARTGLPLAEVECALLGVTRRDLALEIIQNLGLPEAIAKPIVALYAPGRGAVSRDPLNGALRLADAYANGMLLAASSSSPLIALTQAECRAAIGNPNPSIPDAAQFRADVFAQTGMLARLTTAEERTLMEPLRPRSDKKVHLIRDPQFSQFDPIEAAINSLADVQRHDSIPDGEELDGQPQIISARAADTPGFTSDAIARISAGSKVLWLVGKPDPYARIANRGAEPDNLPQATPLPIPIDDLAAFIAAA